MTESRWRKRGYGSGSNWSNPLHDAIMENHRTDLEKWQRDQPISILQLDPSDRIVLKVAGKPNPFFLFLKILLSSIPMTPAT